MNKWIRGILYAAAGCAGIGCAALILGLTLGKGKVDAKDYGSLNFAKNTAYNIVVKIEDKMKRWLDGGGNDVQQGTGESGDNSVSKGYVIEQDGSAAKETGAQKKNGAKGLLNVNADQIAKLDIQLAHGGLEILEADADQIWVGADKDAGDISVTCEGDQVVVRDNRTGSQRRRDANIYMEIPSSAQFREIDIQVGAGVLNIEEPLKADRITLNADAGEIFAEQLSAGDFTASVGAGLVQVNEGVFSGNVKLDCGVGEMDLYDAVMEADADISCGMGTVDISLNGNVKDADYVINCGMGAIDIGDRSYSAVSNNEYINNNADKVYTVSCGMGTITID